MKELKELIQLASDVKEFGIDCKYSGLVDICPYVRFYKSTEGALHYAVELCETEVMFFGMKKIQVSENSNIPAIVKKCRSSFEAHKLIALKKQKQLVENNLRLEKEAILRRLKELENIN